MASTHPAVPQLVIVGGGAAGLELATRLGDRRRMLGAQVTLVDAGLVHLWKPRLHEVAAGLMGSGDDETSYLAHGRVHGFSFQWGALTRLDARAKTIRLGPVCSRQTGQQLLDERELAYDTLVLCIGSRVNDFGIPGVAKYCHVLDRPTDAWSLQRAFIEAAIKVAGGRLACLRVGIVGAGATGVELAAELHHAVHAMSRYGGLGAPGQLQITIMDQAARVLPATDPATSQTAQLALERLGIQVLMGQSVREVNEAGFVLANGHEVPCEIKVWASGVVGHELADTLTDLKIVRGRKIEVDQYLRCVGVEHIYAMGDCAAVPAGSGDALVPPTAQGAHQQANYLTQAFMRAARGRPVEPFRFHSRGTLVSLGAAQASGEFPTRHRAGGLIRTQGSVAKLLYVSLYFMHRVALHGWWRAVSLVCADWLRGITSPPVKLH